SPARPASRVAVRVAAACAKKARRSDRPTGRRAPAPAARAALAYLARWGARIVREPDAPSLGRVARPRAGWWRRAQRARLPLCPLRQRQRKREASLQRQAWGPSCAWSRLTSGVWLRVLGAVAYGTSPVCAKLCRAVIPRRC